MLIALIFGSFTTYLFIIGTKHIQAHFVVLWPGRFIGFAIGTFIFAILTWAHLSEGINLKTAISLVLAALLMIIQLFWK